MAKASTRMLPPRAMVEITAKGLVPVGPYDQAILGQIRRGTVCDVVPRRKRSNPQLGLYWLTLQAVVDATGAWATSSHLHDLLVRECGFKTAVLNPFTGLYEEARDSIAFEAMPQDEFNSYMDTALNRLSEALGVDVTELLPQESSGSAAA